MKLLINNGDRWRTRGGRIVVAHCNDGDDTYPWNMRYEDEKYETEECADYKFSVNAAGQQFTDEESDLDLVELVSDRFRSGIAREQPMILPEDPKVRKGMPITTGVVDYFPLALAEVAVASKAGNDQHNPGQPLHWEKGLSTDHADCIMRHLIDRGARDTDGMRHSAKLAWRALALLQTELEAEAAAKA